MTVPLIRTALTSAILSGIEARTALDALPSSINPQTGVQWLPASGAAGVMHDIEAAPHGTSIAVRAVSGGGLRSTDGGKTWTSVSGLGGDLRGVAHIGYRNEWMVVRKNAGSQSALKSMDDGVTWAPMITPSADSGWHQVRGVDELGIAVAVANEGRVMTVEQGDTWAQRAVPSAGILQSLDWSPDQKLLFMASQGGGVGLISLDGKSYRAIPIPDDGHKFTLWVRHLRQWCTCTNTNNIYLGRYPWELALVPGTTPNLWHALCEAEEAGLLVFAGQGGGQNVGLLKNGAEWSTASVSGEMQGAAWSPTHKRLMLVGKGGAAHYSPEDSEPAPPPPPPTPPPLGDFDTGWLIAGSGINSSETGVVAWSNPGNITADNTNEASAAMTGQGNTNSKILRATSFGLDVPDGVTPQIVEIAIKRRMSGGQYVEDYLVRLRTAAGQVGPNKAVPGAWSETEQEVTYSLDATGFTPADLRSAEFGVDIRAQRTNGSTALVNCVKARVLGG